MKVFLCWLQILVLGLGSLAAQSSKAVKIKQDVEKIGVAGNITVYMPDGHEYYGSVSRAGADDFAVNDIDLKREVTVRYDEVKKVRSGYGTGPGRTINGKRVHPHTKLITTLAIVGGLIVLVFVAVASDKS